MLSVLSARLPHGLTQNSCSDQDAVGTIELHSSGEESLTQKGMDSVYPTVFSPHLHLLNSERFAGLIPMRNWGAQVYLEAEVGNEKRFIATRWQNKRAVKHCLYLWVPNTLGSCLSCRDVSLTSQVQSHGAGADRMWGPAFSREMSHFPAPAFPTFPLLNPVGACPWLCPFLELLCLAELWEVTQSVALPGDRVLPSQAGVWAVLLLPGHSGKSEESGGECSSPPGRGLWGRHPGPER